MYCKTHHVFRFLNSNRKLPEIGKIGHRWSLEPGFPKWVPGFRNWLPGFPNWVPGFLNGVPSFLKFGTLFPEWGIWFPETFSILQDRA